MPVCLKATPESQVQGVGQALAGAAAALTLSLSAFSGAAVAGEFDILTEAAPTARYVLDDAGVLSKNTKGTLNSNLKSLEVTPPYSLPPCHHQLHVEFHGVQNRSGNCQEARIRNRSIRLWRQSVIWEKGECEREGVRV